MMRPKGRSPFEFLSNVRGLEYFVASLVSLALFVAISPSPFALIYNVVTMGWLVALFFATSPRKSLVLEAIYFMVFPLLPLLLSAMLVTSMKVSYKQGGIWVAKNGVLTTYGITYIFVFYLILIGVPFVFYLIVKGLKGAWRVDAAGGS